MSAVGLERFGLAQEAYLKESGWTRATAAGGLALDHWAHPDLEKVCSREFALGVQVMVDLTGTPIASAREVKHAKAKEIVHMAGVIVELETIVPDNAGRIESLTRETAIRLLLEARRALRRA
jgi:hypothetical protein